MKYDLCLIHFCMKKKYHKGWPLQASNYLIYFFYIQNCIWHIFNRDFLQMYMYLTLYTYCVTPRLPARGADLSVSVRVLEGLDQSQRLVHGSPHREIIHGDLAQRSFRINDKQTPEKQQRPYHLSHRVRSKA